jgi:hypothetical protein
MVVVVASSQHEDAKLQRRSDLHWATGSLFINHNFLFLPIHLLPESHLTRSHVKTSVEHVVQQL